MNQNQLVGIIVYAIHRGLQGSTPVGVVFESLKQDAQVELQKNPSCTYIKCVGDYDEIEVFDNTLEECENTVIKENYWQAIGAIREMFVNNEDPMTLYPKGIVDYLTKMWHLDEPIEQLPF